MENILILLFLFLALIVIFNLLIKKLKLSNKNSNRKIIGNVYENKKFLFTPAEKSFLCVLDNIFNQDFRIPFKSCQIGSKQSNRMKCI